MRAGGLTAETVRAESRHGSVRVSFSEAPRTVTARTRDGAVEVVVPDDEAAYDVEVDTFVGDTDSLRPHRSQQRPHHHGHHPPRLGDGPLPDRLAPAQGSEASQAKASSWE